MIMKALYLFVDKKFKLRKNRRLREFYWFTRRNFPYIFIYRVATRRYRNWYINRTFPITESDNAPNNGEFSHSFRNHQGKKSQKWSHFLSIYDEIIPEVRKKFASDVTILEIGVQGGGSLEIWRALFGERSRIFGIDIDPVCALLEIDAEIRIGSVSDREFLLGVARELGSVNLIIDDGSHDSKDQRIAFEILFPHLTESGLYIIEDLEHSYYWSKHGGYLRPGSIIQKAKRLVDEMNSDYFLTPPLSSFSVNKRDIHSVTFYQGLLVIRKSTRPKTTIITTESK